MWFLLVIKNPGSHSGTEGLALEAMKGMMKEKQWWVFKKGETFS